jgi:hypothetical protein
VKTRVTLQLLEEMSRFDLRFTCEECAHFTGDRCAHGWPGGERRRALRAGDDIEFCKEFEGH